MNCRHCGVFNVDGANYCRGCGKQLDDNQNGKERNVPVNKKNIKKLLWIFLRINVKNGHIASLY